MQTKRNIASLVLLTCTLLSACKKDDDSGTTTDSSTDFQLNSAYTVASVLAENAATHEETSDYTWDTGTENHITLNGNSISTDATAVTISGAIATITDGGNYRISGTLSNGQIRVETADNAAIVRLILDGINVNNSNSSPLYVVNASKTIIFLATGTSNSLTDGSSYTYENTEAEEPNATLFSHDPLTITGEGSLTVNANFADAITSKDGLILAGGVITVASKDDAIRGKDYLVVRGSSLDIVATGDGLKSDNDSDATLGFVLIEDADANITAGADAIQATTDVLIKNGTFVIKTSNSSGNTAKGLKAGSQLVVDAGTFTLNTSDDALHSNNNLCINAGTFSISSLDDGIHADTSLSINGGEINITKSYEGIESRAMAIRGGTVRLVASDDGLNAAGGNDGSASTHFPGASTSSNTGFFILITGGYISVQSTGDGMDANGSIEMTGGTLLVNGPTAQNNAALDYDASFNIKGGLLVAVGSSGMAQGPGASSSQYSILASMGGTISAGTLVHLESSDGAEVVTFKPAKSYQTVVISAPDLKNGTSYKLYKGGSSSGTVVDGLYSGGTYTAGSVVADFTISSMVTRI